MASVDSIYFSDIPENLLTKFDAFICKVLHFYVSGALRCILKGRTTIQAYV